MTDILLDQQGGNCVVVDAFALKISGPDLLLDSAGRRGTGTGVRRALVHDQNDGLTINFNRDYPGGVTIENAILILKASSSSKLPRQGKLGELHLLRFEATLDGRPVGTIISLWLCVGPSRPKLGEAVAAWREIPLGDSQNGEI